jgi:hypothetical protein
MVGDERSARLKISDLFMVQLLNRSISSLRRDKKLKLKSGNLSRSVKLCKTIHWRLVLLYIETELKSTDSIFQIVYLMTVALVISLWWHSAMELGACRS